MTKNLILKKLMAVCLLLNINCLMAQQNPYWTLPGNYNKMTYLSGPSTAIPNLIDVPLTLNKRQQIRIPYLLRWRSRHR